MNAQNRFSLITQRVFLDSLIRLTSFESCPFISTTSADSIAISVPFPIATPISDAAREGASLMPSPTMIVTPFFLKSSTKAAFWSGRTR